MAAVNLHEHQHLALEDILACVGFSESSFWRTLKLWHETGDVVRCNVPVVDSVILAVIMTLDEIWITTGSRIWSHFLSKPFKMLDRV
ncbi:hypothetical protein BDR07DRAFT_138444 [Suillus spraguei]|nr:hypothetical protein BDR07DRAFT_138444 [Suillus spraguei]